MMVTEHELAERKENMCEAARIRRLKQRLQHEFGHAPTTSQIVRSPYRICPLGAHIDHQGGWVTGMCLDHSVLLAYVPNRTGEVRLYSENFEGLTHFQIHEAIEKNGKHWSNYARGAVFALKKKFSLRYGMDGIIQGNLPVGGLSSSAAVGLAYLFALEQVNEIEVSRTENIYLDQVLENEFIGLHNGILDQATILLSQKNKLMFLDCQTATHQLIDGCSELPHFQIMVVYSGLSETLMGTGYNSRVAECRLATQTLLESADLPVTADLKLRSVPRKIFEQYGAGLAENLQKRARHFFTEMARVEQGIQYWQQGDLSAFGALMNASGQSSIENYECGSPQLITIYQLLAHQPGVHGARFSGAGFRGSCIALIDPAAADSLRTRIETEYPRRHPDLKDKFQIFICDCDSGITIL